jgi:site-specific DNA recombinase
MRVALYARYSDDKQRAASIDDQLRDCRAYAARQGWHVVATFSDAAISGASLLRPGVQSLLRCALAGDVDVVLTEALDRLSRDQEDTAGLFKRLRFAGVQLVTISEGEISHLHVGLKGTMNALYLIDLADKTRRGLRGRVEAGKSGGGVCYGYRVVRTLDPEAYGERAIDEGQAAVVRRIFRAFVEGTAPKAIARMLNAEGVPGPRGVAWSPSTIHGHASRGTGILNNELYIGRLVWNRQRFVKDPDTGRRVARLNPKDAWVTTDVPHLRIVDDALWDAAKARQAAARRNAQTGIVRNRRPKYLFSGLTKCATCGGGFILSSRDQLVCFNARERGTCGNRRKIGRQEVEERVLRAMRERLFDRECFEEFCRAYTKEMTRLRRELLAEAAGAKRELATTERKIKEILRALSDGYRCESWKAELLELEARKAELARLTTAPELPALHPAMADAFRAKAETLAAGLLDDERHDAARQALRGFIEKIVIPPDGVLQLVGNLGAMLAMADGRSLDSVGIVGCGGGI